MYCVFTFIINNNFVLLTFIFKFQLFVLLLTFNYGICHYSLFSLKETKSRYRRYCSNVLSAEQKLQLSNYF